MLYMQVSDPVNGSKGLIHKLATACHIRQWKSKCGMRRPSLGQNEDDLSRLTTIISPTSISLSSNGQSDPVVVVVAGTPAVNDVVSCGRAKANVNHHHHQQQQQQQQHGAVITGSSSICNSSSSCSCNSSSSSNSSASNNTSSSSSNCPASNNSCGGGGAGGHIGLEGSRTSSSSSASSNSLGSGSGDGVGLEAVGNGKDAGSSLDAGAGCGGGGGVGETLPPPPPPPSSVLVIHYLPNLINSSEWQNCRKRKERQDSTSSISQDRKLIRSNSEEHLPNCQEVIRRVSSHEDFKKRTGAAVPGAHGLSVEISVDKENIIAEEESIDDGGAGEDGDGSHHQQQVFEKNLKNSADDLKKFFIGSVENVANGGGLVNAGKDHHHQQIVHQLGGHHHHHHSNHHLHHHHAGGKAQQHHRLSPCRDILKSRRDSDSEQDGEHERRRHCERFSKTRPPPGRKSVSPRSRSSKHSKFAAATVKAAANVGGSVVLATGNEHFYSKHDNHSTGGSKSERRRSPLQQAAAHRHHSDDAPMFDPRSGSDVPHQPPLSDYNDNNVLEKDQAAAAEAAQQQPDVQPPEEEPLSPREKLPWGQSYPDDTPALVCQRFADDKFDHAKRMDSVSHAKLRPVPSGGSLKLYGAHHRSAENAPPGHHHHGKPAAASTSASNMFDDRVKAINRKLSGLKKKLTQYEERFERDHGCRPTHGDKSADPAIKGVVVEIHKLRKEKNQIKSELAVFSAKAAAHGASAEQQARTTGGGGGGEDGGTSEEKRLGKMRDTIADIEKRLTDKREVDERSENLELLTSEQLTEEKASVQRALLYLESMYGRPASREERDAARPLYDRYRLIKRLVNRANSISGPCGVANSLMPTILEHEALAIVAGTTTPSTDISPPSATSTIQSPTDTLAAGHQSTDESEATTTTTTTSNSATENIHSMTPDELWQHYDATREEKKELRRTIKDFEQQFEETTGRKMLKSDRKSIEETYALYKQKKAKLRLIDALFKKQMQV